MKFKNKIIISFCIILFVPILLAVLVLFGFQKIQIKAIEQTYGIAGNDYNYLSNSTQLLHRFTKDSYEKLKSDAEKHPEKFEDDTYLDEVNEELRQKCSYLVVRRDNALVYIGTDAGNSLLTQLPAYGENSNNAYSGTYIDGDEQALIKQVDFVYPGGGEGSAFIITVLEDSVPELKSLAVDGIVSIFLILVLTACILTVWIYTSMINPIKKLQTAVQNIKEGNLDFVLEVDGDDEFSELCRDFEEMRKRLKESAEEKVLMDKENKELISNISHDLKTPITAVKGYVEGIMDGVADTPEKIDRYVKTIYNKTNEMDHLINELTFYSKIDTNRIPYTFSKLNVEDYFSDCAEEVGLELETRGIELVYANYVEDNVQVIADGEQIRRVIHNIISNAIKYMDKPKGIIQIRIKDVGDFIQVEIEDNGKGIAAKDLPSIFDRFYRTDVSRNSSKGGSGIGLSIVKKILEDHGGKVWATSRLGIGTIMYFVLRKYQEVPMN